MRILKGKRELVTGRSGEVDAKNCQQVVEFGPVDDAEAVELVDARDGVLVFELREPSV